VTAIADTPEITASVIGVSPCIPQDIGQARPAFIDYTVLISPVINSVGTTVLKIGPGLPGLPNLVANDMLPPFFRVDIAHADTDSITYSVSINFNG
jgi:hypothetical protein